MNRVTVGLYLLTLFLLPWAWLPPFPWIHPHAQWSDAALAATVVFWVAGLWRARERPRLGGVHVAFALYFLAAAASFVFSNAGSGSKLLGMGSLAALAVVTADLASRPGVSSLIGRALALTALGTATAAALGVGLFLAGRSTPLVGTYGDLVAGPYARAQAGLYHPNLLASFAIFAAGVVASDEVSTRLRRIVLLALSLTVVLTLSRGILGFFLALLVRRATTPRSRGLAGGFALLALAALTALTVFNVSLDPTRPLEVRIERGPSSRLQATVSAARTFLTHPFLGAGPGTTPGWKDGRPFDAHLTPLNVAATLGLPALLAFLAIPVLLWRERRRPPNLALWGALAGTGLDALAQDVEDFRHVWVLFGLVEADGRRAAAPTLEAGRDAPADRPRAEG